MFSPNPPFLGTHFEKAEFFERGKFNSKWSFLCGTTKQSPVESAGKILVYMYIK